MAKYCVKCGKPLPDGVEICPECNVATEAAEAALFTRITADTEVWKDPGAKVKRPKRTRSQKEKLGFALASVLVLGFLVFSILVTRPAMRTARAIRSGDYDRAVEIYWGAERLSTGERVPMLDKVIRESAETLCRRFAAQEISAEEASEALGKLGTLGDGAEALLADVFEEFRALCRSQDHMAEGEKLFLNGEFLDARAEFLQVSTADGDYAAAQEKAEECLNSYGMQVVADAEKKSSAADFPAAIALLQTGNRTLEEYGTFSPEIDAALDTCFADYETQLLTEAQNLSALGDNDAAAALIAGGIGAYDLNSDAMHAAQAQYLQLARADEISAARARADEQYAAENFAGAFAELELLRETLEGDRSDLEAEIGALEAQFVADRIEKAQELFGGDRETLPQAVELLTAAVEARPLEELERCLEDFAQYLPLDLTQADVLGKTGTVFRSKSSFEAVDGTSYTGGWIWGADDAEIRFKLDGAYDVFTADFAVRRADNRNANGHFELYCDGEQIFKSETLYHWQKDAMHISVDISGCDELKLVFTNDYKVSTAEDGYCYHGLCTPQVMKDLPED